MKSKLYVAGVEEVYLRGQKVPDLRRITVMLLDEVRARAKNVLRKKIADAMEEFYRSRADLKRRSRDSKKALKALDELGDWYVKVVDDLEGKVRNIYGPRIAYVVPLVCGDYKVGQVLDELPAGASVAEKWLERALAKYSTG